MHDLTAFQRDCIRAIAVLDNPNGLEISERLEEYYESGVYHGRLYPNLNELVSMGLVSKSEVDGRTNSYALTPRGRREVDFQTSEWEEAMDSITVEAVQ